jgi:hypothetical protein
MGLFRRKRAERAPAEAEAEDMAALLRRNALGLSADQLGLPEGTPVVALLMETGHELAVATLLGVADGTTSLYLSNGGGVIGAGQHPAVAAATAAWLRALEPARPLLAPAEDPGPPGEGCTQFVAVTPEGLLSAAARESELAAGDHALSPLFLAAQAVITQVRLAQSA